MKVLGWLLVFALGAAAAYWFRSFRRRRDELTRASEERMASFMAEAMAGAKAPPDPGLAQQRLLFDAATKAGEANEPVLAIQLYARLIARYPDCALAAQARAAVQTQKTKLAKASRAPDTSAPG